MCYRLVSRSPSLRQSPHPPPLSRTSNIQQLSRSLDLTSYAALRRSVRSGPELYGPGAPPPALALILARGAHLRPPQSAFLITLKFTPRDKGAPPQPRTLCLHSMAPQSRARVTRINFTTRRPDGVMEKLIKTEERKKRAPPLRACFFLPRRVVGA